jgi:tetratricopeptide (TPR) repeat protein
MRTRTTLTCLIALVAVASAVPGVAQTTDELARAQLAKGEERLAAGDLLSAESELRKTIEEFPSTEWAHWARVRLADCLLRQNRLDESINVARGVVNVCPASSPRLAAAWAQYYVGLGYKAKDELDAQIWEMEKVESILGDHEDRGPLIKAKYELALAHHNRNDREKSISLCHEILSEKNATDDDRAWACVILGSSLADSGKTDEALSVLDRVRNEFPSLQEQVLAAERLGV